VGDGVWEGDTTMAQSLPVSLTMKPAVSTRVLMSSLNWPKRSTSKGLRGDDNDVSAGDMGGSTDTDLGNVSGGDVTTEAGNGDDMRW
jgi:hypothetical protein